MTKDEILKISRKENSVSDERTEYIGLKGANFSVSILILLWIILSRFTPMDQAAKYAMGPVSYTHLDVYKRQEMRRY